MHETALSAILRDLGLSQYEVKCYLSLLERDTLTAAEISRLARIPRPGAYDALEKLTSKGLCTTKPGDTKRYSASDPALLEEKCIMTVETTVEAELRDLKERERQLREKARDQKEDISKAIAELKPRYQNSREETSPLDYIEIIKDPHQVHRRYMELVGKMRTELIGFTKAPFTVSRELVKAQTAQQEDILRRGIQIRTIYEVSPDEDERRWLFQLADRAVRIGAEVRALARLPMKMMVLDTGIVIFTLEDPVSRQISLTTQVIEHHALAESLRMLFESLWQRAEDYHILEV
jgi:sugar-specific transcriptional regulator TrmB